jgi:hypothetical protein
MDKGYDASHFAEYMGNQKENGLDIDNWTLNELY